MKLPTLRPKPVLALAACLFLFSADIFQYRQTRFLEARIRAMTTLAPGAQMEALAGLSESGASAVVDFDAQPLPTLVLVFSPTCGACSINWPAWETVLSAVGPATARVVAVNLGEEAPPTYEREHSLQRFQVIARPLAHGVLGDNLQVTPETLVVGRDGRVKRAWIGVLGMDDACEIEILLDVPKGPCRSALKMSGAVGSAGTNPG